MKQRVYIETTIVSYLTAKPSVNLIIAAHQEITRQWWEKNRQEFDLFVARIVLDEAGRGNAEASAKRLAILRDLPELTTTPDAERLAMDLVGAGLLPEQAGADAMHLAVATVHKMDVLLTWNCRHLANGKKLGQIGRFVRTRNYELPTVCTPDELVGDLEVSGD